MRAIHLRIHALFIGFTVSILSSVCLGYYGMEESSFRKDQEQHIFAELALSQKLGAEIERREAVDLMEAAAKEFMAESHEYSATRAQARERILELTRKINSYPESIDFTPALEDIVDTQKELAELKLGVFSERRRQTLRYG